MNKMYMKQSNWLLGIGIIVAIMVIISSIWMGTTSTEPVNAGNNNSNTEIGQSINSVMLLPFRMLTSVIKPVL